MEGGTVVGLINNVGQFHQETLDKFPPEKIDSHINLNIVSHVFLTQKLIPTMDRGFVVFTSSSSSILNLPYIAHYAGTKSFITAFTNSLIKEHPNLDMLSVHPLMVSTVLIHNQKANFSIATPEDVVKGAMKDLGRRRMSIGSWKQSLIYWGLCQLPEFLLNFFMKRLQQEQLNLHREQRAAKN